MAAHICSSSKFGGGKWGLYQELGHVIKISRSFKLALIVTFYSTRHTRGRLGVLVQPLPQPVQVSIRPLLGQKEPVYCSNPPSFLFKYNGGCMFTSGQFKLCLRDTFSAKPQTRALPELSFPCCISDSINSGNSSRGLCGKSRTVPLQQYILLCSGWDD